MKVKTANLIDRALDYAVALALNPTELPNIAYLADYSQDIDLANDLIETYGIVVRQRGADWIATMQISIECGPTREIAVAQCFAVSRLGEFVEIPDELLF